MLSSAEAQSHYIAELAKCHKAGAKVPSPELVIAAQLAQRTVEDAAWDLSHVYEAVDRFQELQKPTRANLESAIATAEAAEKKAAAAINVAREKYITPLERAAAQAHAAAVAAAAELRAYTFKRELFTNAQWSGAWAVHGVLEAAGMILKD